MYEYTYRTIPFDITTVPFNENPNDDITCIHTRVNIGTKKIKATNPTRINRNSEHSDFAGLIAFNPVSNVTVPNVEPNFDVTSSNQVNFEGANDDTPTLDENSVQVVAADIDESISCCRLSCFSSMLRFLRKKLSERRNYKGLEEQKTERDSVVESTNSASRNPNKTPGQICNGFITAGAENESSTTTVEVVEGERSDSYGAHADSTKNDAQNIGHMSDACKSDGGSSHQYDLVDKDKEKVDRSDRNQISRNGPTNDYLNSLHWVSCNANNTIQQPSLLDIDKNEVGAGSQNQEQNPNVKRKHNRNKRAKRHKGESSTANQELMDKVALPSKICADEYLEKYYYQRYRLFSKFDQGIKLDAESWYSVTPEKISRHQADRCRSDVIIDGFCGAGGNTIQFAFTCERVIAIDIDPKKVELAKHNASIYNVADRIEFIVGDFFELAPMLKADVVFLSPPWGGPSYNQTKSFPLSQILEPFGGKHLYEVARQISEHLAFYLPRNVEKNDVVRLARRGEKVEIEENLMNNKLVAITAYFGELVYEEEESEEANDCSSF